MEATTIAKDMTLAQVIKAMRIAAKRVAESTYCYTDLLEDITLLAEHSPAERLRIYWGVRKNGTVLRYNMVQMAKWAAEQELENEAPQCYLITCEDGLFTFAEVK